MSDINITIEGGTSKRLKTAGKYCDRDIVVTSTGTAADLQEQIDSMNADIAATYLALEAKGATMPDAMTSDNLAATAESVIVGVMTEEKLALANATEADVYKGLTFYAGDETLKTGTLALSGTATAADVLSGKTFYNTNAKSKQTGTLTSSNIVKKSQKVTGNVTMEPGVTGTITLTFTQLSKVDGITAVTASQVATNGVTDLRVGLTSISISGNTVVLKFKNGSSGYPYKSTVSVTAFENTL